LTENAGSEMAIADQLESRTQYASPARKDRRTGTGHGAVGYGCRRGRETAWVPVAGGSARDQGAATAKVDANALLTAVCAAAHRPDENGERSVPILKKTSRRRSGGVDVSAVSLCGEARAEPAWFAGRGSPSQGTARSRGLDLRGGGRARLSVRGDPSAGICTLAVDSCAAFE